MKKIIRKLGVFDSGVGGLSVLQELRRLPITEFVYVADTANLPYGEKTPEQIRTFSEQIVRHLVAQNVDAVVIACHTASAIALEHVRKLFPELPIIGVVDSVVLAALQQSPSKKIGVIATPATVKSGVHKNKIEMLNKRADVFPQACPLLVPIIEAGIPDKEQLRNILTGYIAPLQEKGCDTLIIGCTHYELIKKEIGDIASTMTLISAPTLTAIALKDALTFLPSAPAQTIIFQITGNAEQFKMTAEKLVGQELEKVEKIGL